ncbi:MAG: hypothetical protein GY750_01285 [Lentisphaerae bacterium]|nr:hypothetical protein [Lentisphaerota bacterium]MCP4100052.1 hypothetical protein [Lentisphaerota bacterium]
MISALNIAFVTKQFLLIKKNLHTMRIKQTFSQSDANCFQKYCLSPSDEKIIITCMTKALSRLPYEPYYCVHLNAILWQELKNSSSFPVYLIAGCLEINNQRIFGNDNTNYVETFSKSQQFDGHCWIAVGGERIIEISLFRTLDNIPQLSKTKSYIERINQGSLPGAMMNLESYFLCKFMNYIPKYILSEKEINNLVP